MRKRRREGGRGGSEGGERNEHGCVVVVVFNEYCYLTVRRTL